MNFTLEPPLPIITEAIDFEETWVKIGQTQNIQGFTSIGLFLDIDINDSQNIQIKIVGRTSLDSIIEYLLPVYEVTVENVISFAGSYFILDKNEDQSLIIKTKTDNLIPYIDIYMKVGTKGATSGKLLHADLSKSWSNGGN